MPGAIEIQRLGAPSSPTSSLFQFHKPNNGSRVVDVPFVNSTSTQFFGDGKKSSPSNMHGIILDENLTQEQVIEKITPLLANKMKLILTDADGRSLLFCAAQRGFDTVFSQILDAAEKMSIIPLVTKPNTQTKQTLDQYLETPAKGMEKPSNIMLAKLRKFVPAAKGMFEPPRPPM